MYDIEALDFDEKSDSDFDEVERFKRYAGEGIEHLQYSNIKFYSRHTILNVFSHHIASEAHLYFIRASGANLLFHTFEAFGRRLETMTFVYEIRTNWKWALIHRVMLLFRHSSLDNPTRILHVI